MKSASYAIDGTAVKIVASSPGAQNVYIHVEGNAVVYLGGADVTTSNGMPTEKNAVPINIFVPRGNELWGICGAGTENVRILTEGA